eukprot:GHVT01010180.1.p2 GENE.GHVT01010180.1~~GHVT01010180.1.p2  ORF type:complete len:125 (-),score=15.95 GHVT01010180.1:884-1258(-)
MNREDIIATHESLADCVIRATRGFREWMRSQLPAEARKDKDFNDADPAWWLQDEPQHFLRLRNGRYETRHRAEHFAPGTMARSCCFCKGPNCDTGLHLALGWPNLPHSLRPPPPYTQMSQNRVD